MKPAKSREAGRSGTWLRQEIFELHARLDHYHTHMHLEGTSYDSIICMSVRKLISYTYTCVCVHGYFASWYTHVQSKHITCVYTCRDNINQSYIVAYFLSKLVSFNSIQFHGPSVNNKCYYAVPWSYLTSHPCCGGTSVRACYIVLYFAMLCNHQILSSGITWKWKQLTSFLIFTEPISIFIHVSAKFHNFILLPVSEK